MTGVHAKLRLEIGQFSHPGQRRPNNEDWLATFQPGDPEQLRRKGCLFVVADGMGGHQSGEMASRFAADQLIRRYMGDRSPDVAASLQGAIEAANKALYDRAVGSEAGGRWGTTVVAAVVRGNQLWIANVGDSRAYLLRDRQLRQLSRDHDLASELGVKAQEGWRGRHLVTRAVGQKPEVQVDLFPALRLRSGDKLLLCSDGLTNPLSNREIRDIAADLPAQAAAHSLVQAANEHGGPDNVSVIVVQATGRGGALGWQAAMEMAASLVRRETWQQAASAAEQFLARRKQNWRSPLSLAIFVLSAACLVLVGFVLGWLILRLF